MERVARSLQAGAGLVNPDAVPLLARKLPAMLRLEIEYHDSGRGGPLRIPRAAPLMQPERGRARRRGLIRTLGDTFRNNIRDQEVGID